MSHRFSPPRLVTRRHFGSFVIGSAGVALLTHARGALAQSTQASINALVMVMHATQTDGGASIDPGIGEMPQLKKPPFSAYNTYKLLDKKLLPLEKGKPVTHALITGRTLQVTLLDVTADKRFHVGTAINQPGGAAFLKLLEVTASANEPFFVAGQSYQGGTLVLGITIKP